MTAGLAEQLRADPHVGYAYAYPHKTAYRRLDPPRSLRELWAREDRSSLFLYLHVPFCEARCGYCNLFSSTRAVSDLAPSYVAALERQARAVAQAIPRRTFAQVAIGGGTPALLGEQHLARLFEVIEGVMGAPLGRVGASIELSPSTCSESVLRLLREAGVSRVSLGVQSFWRDELLALGRSASAEHMDAAFAALEKVPFPVLNLDLIYGVPGQTAARLQHDLRQALARHATEIYLYPLYVRPGTALGRRQIAPQERRQLYRAACETLGEAGFVQRSMRRFCAPACDSGQGSGYECQRDGMVGLGCGARSYTRALHYSDEYAVDGDSTAAILRAYCGRSVEELQAARHGFALDREEQRRRYVIKTLLLVDGVDRGGYARELGTDVMADFPALADLSRAGLAQVTDDRVRLTPAGLELSDAIGPWLYSPTVRALMTGKP